MGNQGAGELLLLLVTFGLGVTLCGQNKASAEDQASPQVEEYATIEGITNGVPVWSFSNLAYIYGVSPDLMPGVVMEEGNHHPIVKIQPKKSWEIKSNLVGGALYEKQGKDQAAIDVYVLSLARFGAQQELHDRMYSRLLALMKVKASVDAKVKLASNLSHLQRTTLGKLPMKPGSAEFWLVIERDGSIEQVQFISGTEAFRSLEKTIASLKFKSPFPDNAPTKLLRRGALVCIGADYGCDFTLQDPRSVQFSGHVNVIMR